MNTHTTGGGMKSPTTEELIALSKQMAGQRNGYLGALGKGFLDGGFQIIICDFLRDDQVMVSRKVFEAAKKMCEE